jgi:hypothetical protein
MRFFLAVKRFENLYYFLSNRILTFQDKDNLYEIDYSMILNLSICNKLYQKLFS